MTATAIITFFIILLVLVVVHEFGHFLFAKWMKMRVDEFAFGFPPRLFSKKFGETLYSFNLIPLGGYVKIYGENGLDGEHATKDKSRSFSSKSPLARILVLLGGVFFNFLAAIILFTIFFYSNTQKSLTNEEAREIHYTSREVLVANIHEKSEAFGKIPLGSKIVSLENVHEKLEKDILTAEEIGFYITAFPDEKIKISYSPSRILALTENKDIDEKIYSEIKTVEVRTTDMISKDKKMLGISFADLAIKNRTLFDSLKEGTIFTFTVSKMIIKELGKLVSNVFRGEAKIQESLSGPVGLAMITAKVVDQGFEKVLYLAAMLSLSLAVFNILPIPALDGGRILFVLPELLFKKKISPKIENAFHGFGFILLLLLMLVVTYFDILKII